MLVPVRWLLRLLVFVVLLKFTHCLPRIDELPMDVITVMKPGSPSGCADGSEFSFLVRRGKANSIMLDFMGGGACWNGLMCEQSPFKSVPVYVAGVNGQPTAQLLKMFSLFGADMPVLSGAAWDKGSRQSVADWTYVFVPYCTQDIHMGTRVVEYNDTSNGAKLRMHHNGAANVAAVRDWVYANFLTPQTVAFVGCSAGAAGVLTMEAVRAERHYNGGSTKIVTIGDSPTFLLTDEFVQNGLRNWGIECVVEQALGVEVSVLADMDMLWKLWDSALGGSPSVSFAYHTATEDASQIKFWRLMGGMINGTDSVADAAKWKRHMLAVTERLQRHRNFNSFVSDGAGHCGMSFDKAITHSNFPAWASAVLLQDPPGGVTATGCGETCRVSGTVGCDGVRGSKLVEDRCNICGGDGSSCSSSTPMFECAAKVSRTSTSTSDKRSTTDTTDKKSTADTTDKKTTANTANHDFIPGPVSILMHFGLLLVFSLR